MQYFSHCPPLALCCCILLSISGCVSSALNRSPAVVRDDYQSKAVVERPDVSLGDVGLIDSSNEMPVVKPAYVFGDSHSVDIPFHAVSEDACGESPLNLDEAELNLFDRVWQDHCQFYSGDSLTIMTLGFAGGAVMANSSIDERLRHKVQQNIRSASSDDWFEGLHAQKELGNGIYTLPLFAASWAVGEYFDENPHAVLAGTWGERSLRAFAVGAPPMLLAQRVTGASRPGESERNSHWDPFQDDNGVSGHSFMGAIPFLTAARMTEDPWMKTLYYTGSVLAPLSRVNDDHHYTSQAFLGWGLAWLATRAVAETDSPDRNWEIKLIAFDDKQGFAIDLYW